MWEEPCISGKNGSGTVFFSGCSLRCVYCQNSVISTGKSGLPISETRLYEIFFELYEKGVHNINLVTPTHYIPSLVSVISKAKKEGFPLPFVYNTGSYDSVEALRALDGLIDIYLPDFKYFSPLLSKKYSLAEDYPEVCKSAIDEMFSQRGSPVFSDDGMMKSGVIVRHLILPGHTFDSKKILAYLHERYKNDLYISIMNQYTPVLPQNGTFPELNRRVTPEEYDEVVDFAVELGIENAYIQDGEAASESFIPNFYSYEGVNPHN